MHRFVASIRSVLARWFGLALLVTGCAQPAAPPPAAPLPDYFIDQTAASGLNFVYQNGRESNHFTILETLGGGAALLDYDRDGWLDIFLTGGGAFGPNREILGRPNRLFHNEGGWRFRDVTTEVGLPVDGPLFFNHGTAVGDYDNDGWPDLLVTGYGRLALYRNRNGRFEDVTAAAGLRHHQPRHWSTSAAWADLDGDGRLDLCVVQYVNWSFQNHPRCQSPAEKDIQDVCPPERFEPLTALVFRNRGDGTFEDVSIRAGLKPGKGLGVLVADLDDDGRLDIYVANDSTDNHLYWNRGGWRFEEGGRAAGVACNEAGTPDGSMGVAAADCDGSGRLSLFVTNYQEQNHTLYRNNGSGVFSHAVRTSGLAALGRNLVGFGTGFVDFDRDGAEDLFISNGHVVYRPRPPATFPQPAILLRNLHRPEESSVRFEVASERGGSYFREPHAGRGAAFGDLDNDGATDVVVSHCNESVVLLRGTPPAEHHWLGVTLACKDGRSPVGAKLTLEVGGRKLVRVVKGGGSYLSANDERVLFGLGSIERGERLTVLWPSGQAQSWTRANLAVDRYIRVVEGVDPAVSLLPER